MHSDKEVRLKSRPSHLKTWRSQRLSGFRLRDSIPQTGRLLNSRDVFRRLEMQIQVPVWSGKALLWNTDFLLCAHMQEVARDFQSLCFKVINAIHEVHFHDLSISQRTHLLIYHLWGLGFQRMNLAGTQTLKLQHSV